MDVADESVKLCEPLAQEFPRAVFFAGHLVFEQPTLLTRFMHEQTAVEIQRRLQFQGLTVILLPLRVLQIKRPSVTPGLPS